MSSILKRNMNILVGSVVIAALIDAVISQSRDSGILTITLLFFSITIQILINIIAGVVSLLKRDGQFKYYLLSIFWVLLIGLSLCGGGAFLVNFIHGSS